MRKSKALLSILLSLLLGLSTFAFANNDVAAASEGPINIYTRDSASGTREGFESVIGFKGELTDTANEVSSNGDMAAKVGQDLNGIGYVSLTTDFEANHIRPISFEGIEATTKNTVSGDYSLARPFAYATRAEGDYESQEKEDLIKAFIAFMTESTEGLEAVFAAGGIVDLEAGKAWEEVKVDHPIVGQDNSHLEIVTVGSTSVEKAVNAALENFQPLAGNFQFRMNQTGSGDGWKRVLGDEKDGPNKGDIGFASRAFKTEEEPVENAINSGTICQDAIVVVVNAENTDLESFAQNQLYAIFTGQAGDWSEIPEAELKEATSYEGPVNVYTRDSASGTREGFESVIGFKGELTDTANEVSSNGDMAAKIGQDPYGIGYVSLTTDFAANNIRPLFYEGVEATTKNTVSGDYSLARPFVYATRAEGDYESREKEDLIKAFIAFMTESTEGLEAIFAAGGIVDLEAGKAWEEVKVAHPIVDQDNSHLEIVTVGSTSVEKAVNAALENFQPLAGNFQFRMNQTGSGDGWKRVLSDEKDGPNKGDIGFASRDFKAEEPVDEALASGTMCQDAIVVVVNAENPLENLSQADLYALFTGASTDWSELGQEGSGEAITGPFNVYTRDSASGTREGFESVIGFKGELTDTANEVSSNGDMAAKVGQDLNGIGYVSLTTDFEANHIRPISFEGIEATTKNTVSGDYSLARPFAYATRAEGDYESQEKEDLIKAFIAFMTESTEGLEAVFAAGGIVDLEAGKAWEEVKVDHPIVGQDNSHLEIVTVGSTSVEKAVNAALENFQPLAGNFQFRMNQTGSGDGWKRVLGDEKDGPNKGDIGFASRDFKAEEPVDEALASGTMCQDAIVVVVNAENLTSNNFTQAELYDIFTGAITEWPELVK